MSMPNVDSTSPEVNIDSVTVREFLTIISGYAASATAGLEKPGLIQISTVYPDGKTKLMPCRFHIGNVDKMVEHATAYAPLQNVYIEGRTVGEHVIGNKRGKLEDTGHVFALCVDSDTDKNMTGKVPDGATLIVESSGDTGNRHYWFFLDRAITAAEAQEIGKLMRAAIGADHDTGNPVQPYRLAGTPNFPSPEKRERGRVNSMTRIVVEHSRKIWTVDELRALFPAPEKAKPKPKPEGTANDNTPEDAVSWDGEESSLSADLLDLIRDGAPEGDRSERFHYVVGELYRNGATVDQIVELLEKYAGGIAAKYRDRVRQEVERSHLRIEAEEKATEKKISVQRYPAYMNFNGFAKIGKVTIPPGVYYLDIKDGELVRTRVCSPCEIIAETVNMDGAAWGRLLRFRRNDGRFIEHAIPLAMLTANSDAWRTELTDLGMLFEPRNKLAFESYVHSVHKLPQSRKTNVQQVGWNGAAFVLPNAVYGPNAGNIVFQPGRTVQVTYRCAGTIKGWQDGVAAKAIGNPALMFSISCGFTAPMLKPCNAEPGGVHGMGGSSIGKTTLAQAAASVSGDPSIKGGQVLSWRTTDNGMEGACVLHNDNLMVLDEISQARPDQIGDIIYTAFNGAGKNRLERSGVAKKSASWRTFMYSTGEKSIATLMAVAGHPINAGQEVRLLDIPMERKFGCFDVLPDGVDGAAFSKAIKLAASKHHGHPLRAFLTKLTADKSDFVALLEKYKSFPAFAGDPGEEGQALRVFERFALIAMAGELAAEYDIVPWPKGAAIEASHVMLDVWCSTRAQGNQEPAKIRHAMIDFIDKHGSSRFSPLQYATYKGIEVTVHNRAGWTDDDKLLFSNVGLREATKAFDFGTVLDVLVNCGALIPAKSGRRDTSKKILGKTTKVYVIDPEKLDW